MRRKATPAELEVARFLRDEAREYVSFLFPHAQVNVNTHASDEGVNLIATLVDTAAHDRGEVIDALGQLGINDIREPSSDQPFQHL